MGKRCLLAAVALAAGLITVPGAAAAPDERPAASTVTLISGDRVTLHGESVAVTPGAGREQMLFHRRTKGDHVQVVPDDAMPLLASGRLDEQLFDVTALVEQEYDDAHTGELPLLRKGMHITSTDVSKKDALRFWKELNAPGVAATDKIWLDAKVRIKLDQSVPMTNAPSAWELGLRGEGVKVAVLDTGVDMKHPELSVAETRGFTDAGEADVQDRQGHGTHVASTVAGRGEKYRGVAPAASLMVGKVLDDAGSGQLSWIIAGMEWAARSGARVVNMSLGADMVTDGTDPLSQAVNDLTAETGALFVVSAGNRGGMPYAIGAPAAATDALTVGSIEKNGAMSGFSSQGPRFGDDAIKPDITAPGGSIVAARAEGTLNDVAVDDLHARLSGTSMATPHVAGAAALLAQRNPGWKAAELKAALMGSAKPTDGVATSVQGSGQLKLGFGAVRASEGSISFGKLPYPPAGPVSRPVTYFNDGPATTLRLSTTLGAVSPAVLEVPAGGSATATVTYTPGAVGRFEGAVTSALPDGSAGPRVVLGVTQQPEEHNLTLKTVRRDGRPASLPNLILTDGTTAQWPVVPESGVTLRVRPGTYTVLGTMPERTPEFVPESVITFARGGIEVRGDTTVVLDGAESKPITTAFSGDPLARVAGRGDSVGLPGGSGIQSAGRRDMPFYGMSQNASHVEYQSHSVAARPLLLLSAGDFSPVVDYGFGSLHFKSDLTLPVATSGDLRGKLVLLRPSGNTDDQVREAAAAGAVAVVFPFGRFGVWGMDLPIPVLGATEDSFVRMGETRQVSVRTFPASPFSYNLAFTEKSVPNGKKYSVSQRDLARVNVTYRSPGVTSTGAVAAMPSSSTLAFSSVITVPTTFPQQRTEYYTPGKWRRTSSFGLSGYAAQWGPEYSLKRGDTQRHTWLPAVFAPGKTWFERDGDTLRVGLDVFSTNVSDDFGDPEIDQGSLTLSRDGEVFGTSRMPSFGNFEGVTPGPLQLDLVASRPAPWWGLSTQITSRWTFTDTPLIVRYGVADNTMDRHRAFDVSFSKNVKSVQVWSSADDGKSWTQLKARQVGSRWLVLPSGAAGEFTSLRVAAVGTDGDTVDQTVIRAFAVK